MAGSTLAPLPPARALPVLAHLSFLPDDPLAVLRPASVLGSSFSVLDLTTTTGRSALDLAVTLDPAISANVLVEDGDRLRFRHEIRLTEREQAALQTFASALDTAVSNAAAYERLRQATRPEVSLEEKIHCAGEPSLGERLPDTRIPSPEETLIRRELPAFTALTGGRL